MNYAFDRPHAEGAALLTATKLLGDFVPVLVKPKPSIPADLAFPVFGAAKALNAGNPAAFAARLADAVTLTSGGLVARVEAAGPFVNFQADVMASWTTSRRSIGERTCRTSGPKEPSRN